MDLLEAESERLAVHLEFLPTEQELEMISKKLWATGLSAAMIAMMGTPAGALPG